MGLDHTQPAYTDKAAPIIEELGGKLGGLECIRRFLPQWKHLLEETIIIKPGRTLQRNLPSGEYIIRGSHPHDFQGLVDVLPTWNVYSKEGARQTIREKREACRKGPITDFARYENPTYNGKDVVFGIQKFTFMKAGEMTEHPNQPGNYMVSWREGQGGQYVDAGLYDQDGQLLRQFAGFVPPNLPPEQLAVYKDIQRADIVPDDLNFQMEFRAGHQHEFKRIDQVRGYARRQVADFKVKPDYFGFVIGTTPEEGVELPLVAWNEEAEPPPASQPQDWALLKRMHQWEPGLKFRPERLRAYLVNQVRSAAEICLAHGHYRRVLPADVTVFFGPEVVPPVQGGTADSPTKVRIISDGYSAEVTQV